MKRIVMSGVNFVEAGPLSVFQDALHELAASFGDRYEIVALVHRASLFTTAGVRYIEFPEVKSSWLRRLKFEYWDCRALSRELKARMWLSMHDISPCVEAEIRAVYYHNPAPFYRLRARDFIVDRRFALFSMLYHFLFAINIRANNFFIVQQQWIREAVLEKHPGLRVVVAHPSLPPARAVSAPPDDTGRAPRFFYPAYPRSFKNVELLLRACELSQQKGLTNFELWITVDGSENRYSRELKARYGRLPMVHWLGTMPRTKVHDLYECVDYLVFPSRLETWGLPISEFKQTGKPMLLADLPYAHETVGTYGAVSFFGPLDESDLAGQIAAIQGGSFSFGSHEQRPVPAPSTEGWRQMFELLLQETSA